MSAFKYTVGRHYCDYDEVGEISGQAFDCEDCEVFDTIDEAVRDLVDRVHGMDGDPADHLQVLQCTMDETKGEEDSVTDYNPVHSGAIIQALEGIYGRFNL